MSYVDDVAPYTDSVDEAAVTALENRYRLVLTQSDSKLVAYTDPEELERVKQNFVVEKLGVTDDAAADAAIAAVGEKLAGVNFKNRLVVYYLVAEHLGKLDVVRGL